MQRTLRTTKEKIKSIEEFRLKLFYFEHTNTSREKIALKIFKLQEKIEKLTFLSLITE